MQPTALTELVMGYPDFNTGIPQLSDATGSINAVVGSGGLHPNGGIDAVPVTVGLILSATVNVEEHVLVQPFALVIVRLRVKLPQVDPLKMETVLFKVEPVIVPLPVIFQL